MTQLKFTITDIGNEKHLNLYKIISQLTEKFIKDTIAATTKQKPKIKIKQVEEHSIFEKKNRSTPLSSIYSIIQESRPVPIAARNAKSIGWRAENARLLPPAGRLYYISVCIFHGWPV